MGKCSGKFVWLCLGTALVAIHIYRMMPSRSQREFCKNMESASKKFKAAADETIDMVDAVL